MEEREQRRERPCEAGFKEVISQSAFNMLRKQDYQGSFRATRREPMWRFWVELKHRYSELLMR